MSEKMWIIKCKYIRQQVGDGRDSQEEAVFKSGPEEEAGVAQGS